MKFKLTINDSGTSYKKVVQEPSAGVFPGLKIGDKVKGGAIGFKGYEFVITGGSDKTGCPMHKGVKSSDRNKLLKRQKNGTAYRKNVRGNTVSEDISQINLKVVKKGKKELKELLEAPIEKKE